MDTSVTLAWSRDDAASHGGKTGRDANQIWLCDDVSDVAEMAGSVVLNKVPVVLLRLSLSWSFTTVGLSAPVDNVSDAGTIRRSLKIHIHSLGCRLHTIATPTSA